MIPLAATCEFLGDWPSSAETKLFRVSAAHNDRRADRKVSLSGFYGVEAGFQAIGTFDKPASGYTPNIVLPGYMSHLDEGDLISVNPANGRLRVLFRGASNHNSFLVTERCDNYCLMCSQPPRRVNDGYLLDEIAACIPQMPKTVREIGFTGGEPTLLGGRFIEVLKLCKELLPETAVHVLTNGRTFSRPDFAELWSSVGHPDIMAGIPIYSDQSSVHDFVVQADGAFDETIRGILNLKRLRQRVEIRIVLHRHTVGRLDRFADFVVRNLPFVDHVALMGLELMGFAKGNVDDLWIDPREHAAVIGAAAETLDRAGLHTSIYNLPLCVLDQRGRRFAVKSISDWKREYWEACSGCAVMNECGGAFFSSRARLEPYVRPILQ